MIAYVMVPERGRTLAETSEHAGKLSEEVLKAQPDVELYEPPSEGDRLLNAVEAVIASDVVVLGEGYYYDPVGELLPQIAAMYSGKQVVDEANLRYAFPSQDPEPTESDVDSAVSSVDVEALVRERVDAVLAERIDAAVEERLTAAVDASVAKVAKSEAGLNVELPKGSALL